MQRTAPQQTRRNWSQQVRWVIPAVILWLGFLFTVLVILLVFTGVLGLLTE